MQCSKCGSAAVSAGVADDVSCFTCGYHGTHKHAGEPSLHGDSFPAEVSEPAVEQDVEPDEGEK